MDTTNYCSNCERLARELDEARADIAAHKQWATGMIAEVTRLQGIEARLARCVGALEQIVLAEQIVVVLHHEAQCARAELEAEVARLEGLILDAFDSARIQPMRANDAWLDLLSEGTRIRAQREEGKP